MKTTIEIDEDKLDEVMKLTGIPTRKEVVDWALTEALRIARIDKVMEKPWSAEEAKAAFYPDYDVIALRRAREPVNYRKAANGRPKTRDGEPAAGLRRLH